jgi:hypothetical protein
MPWSNFLDRLVHSEFADTFILKGGVLLAALDARRSTRDIDFAVRVFGNSAEKVLSTVRTIAAIPLDDGMTFDSGGAAADFGPRRPSLSLPGCGQVWQDRRFLTLCGSQRMGRARLLLQGCEDPPSSTTSEGESRWKRSESSGVAIVTERESEFAKGSDTRSPTVIRRLTRSTKGGSCTLTRLQGFDQKVGEQPRGGLGGAAGGVDGVQFHRLPAPLGQHRRQPPVL